MNANDIKKAWNTFKRELKKELDFDLTGCCYMNAKQIKKRTATISLCNCFDYDWEIEYSRKSIERVNSYDTWTAEEKKRHEQYELDMIAYYEANREKYGKKSNEAKAKTEAITRTQAFKKLSECIGVCGVCLELDESEAIYRLRINYIAE